MLANRIIFPVLAGVIAAFVAPNATADVDPPGSLAKVRDAAAVVQPPTTIAPGLTYREFTGSGPIVGRVLEADLTEPTLHPTYLYPGRIAAKARLTNLTRRAGAVAGVNGDFFDIGATEAPLGVGLDDGVLRNARAAGWNRAATFFAGSTGMRARLTRVFLDGTIRLPGGTRLKATNLNSPRMATDGVGIYTPAWGTEDRSQVVDGVTVQRDRVLTAEAGESVRLQRVPQSHAPAPTVEVELTHGVVTRVSSTPGGAVAAGTTAVLGVGAGAEALADLRVGDAVDVNYRPASAVDANVAITGNLVLLRDGVVVAPDNPRHPRTAIGFSADGTRVWLVTVDGRSDASVGMTYVELANLMKSLGADDALNLDGGGSTTMVAQMPGDDAPSVRNAPSDGVQRPVPNGLGFVTAAPRSVCLRSNYDFPAYPKLVKGNTGDVVVTAQCLLESVGFDTGAGDPTGTMDTATSAATRSFQAAIGLPVVGRVNAATWTALLSAGDTPLLRIGSKGWPWSACSGR
jgi:peptidoglycan hydrolase-like protein with peptidoglycan-binding domain